LLLMNYWLAKSYLFQKRNLLGAEFFTENNFLQIKK